MGWIEEKCSRCGDRSTTSRRLCTPCNSAYYRDYRARRPLTPEQRQKKQIRDRQYRKRLVIPQTQS